jgi:hypothetical protein
VEGKLTCPLCGYVLSFISLVDSYSQ